MRAFYIVLFLVALVIEESVQLDKRQREKLWNAWNRRSLSENILYDSLTGEGVPSQYIPKPSVWWQNSQNYLPNEYHQGVGRVNVPYRHIPSWSSWSNNYPILPQGESQLPNYHVNAPGQNFHQSPVWWTNQQQAPIQGYSGYPGYQAIPAVRLLGLRSQSVVDSSENQHQSPVDVNNDSDNSSGENLETEGNNYSDINEPNYPHEFDFGYIDPAHGYPRPLPYLPGLKNQGYSYVKPVSHSNDD